MSGWWRYSPSCCLPRGIASAPSLTSAPVDRRDGVEGTFKAARSTSEKAQLDYQIAKEPCAFTRLTCGDASVVTNTKTAVDNAKAAARTALERARTDYVAAVTTSVPNAPQAPLVPPGRGKSWISQGFGKDFGLGWDRRARR